MELAILLPIHNEAGNIEPLVSKLRRVAADLEVGGMAVVLIDDGSTDESAREIDDLVALSSENICVRHERNLGYGATVRNGIAALEQINPRWAMLMDADGTMDPAGIGKFRERILAGDDLVIGCRYGDVNPLDYPFWRKTISWVGSLICRLGFGLRLQDFTLGMRAFTYDAARNWSLQSDTFAILLEMVFQALRNSNVVSNVPITYMGRSGGTSKFRYRPQLVAEYLRYAWQARLWRMSRP